MLTNKRMLLFVFITTIVCTQMLFCSVIKEVYDDVILQIENIVNCGSDELELGLLEISYYSSKMKIVFNQLKRIESFKKKTEQMIEIEQMFYDFSVSLYDLCSDRDDINDYMDESLSKISESMKRVKAERDLSYDDLSSLDNKITIETCEIAKKALLSKKGILESRIAILEEFSENLKEIENRCKQYMDYLLEYFIMLEEHRMLVEILIESIAFGTPSQWEEDFFRIQKMMKNELYEITDKISAIQTELEVFFD